MLTMRLVKKILLWIVILFFGTSVFSVLLLKFIPVYVTPLMIKRAVQTGEWHWHHDWVPLEDISPWLPKAVVAVEDGNFYDHHGVDWNAIKRASEYNKTHNRTQGGSGITQQTVKNVFLWEGNSIATKMLRKPLEVYFAYLADFVWGKERVLEIYLNSIEMGRGVYGAQAAAEFYWHKPAIDLTKRQSVMIACSLKNPIKYNPANPTPGMRKQAAKVMRWI